MAREKKAKGRDAATSERTATQQAGNPSTSGTLPENLELQATRVICGPDINYNVS